MMTENKDSSLPIMPESFLFEFVEGFFEQRQIYIDAVNAGGSPLYLLDADLLKARARQFRAAFSRRLPNAEFYFAMKSNNLPVVSEFLLDEGFGLDVSSGLELKTALELKAEQIVFSGPGKTDEELELAARNNSCVTVLLDSPGELKRLAAILNRTRAHLRVGVRLNNNPEGLWRKFGVALDELKKIYDDIKASPYVHFRGLQFHSSWNLDPRRQIDFISRLGRRLKSMPAEFRESIEFIDIGGGYWPSRGEWVLSEEPLVHHRQPAAGIEIFADELARALKADILSLSDCKICFEPGRWICNDAMHILLKVVDRKAEDLVITDAGTNMIGWERFESDYFPVLNLTRPDMVEKPCHILGSLCTPHDVWGFAYFGKDIREGDILMIPTQGAYTYSLRQQFIKPLPGVYVMDKRNGPRII